MNQAYGRCQFKNFGYLEERCGFDLFPSMSRQFANKQSGKASSNRSIYHFEIALVYAKTCHISTKNPAAVMKPDDLKKN
jgi:hypothetical protein